MLARDRLVGQLELVLRVASDGKGIRRDRTAYARLRAGDHEQARENHIFYCSPFGYWIHLEIQSGSRNQAARARRPFGNRCIVSDLRKHFDPFRVWYRACPCTRP